MAVRKLIRKDFPQVRLIENQENVGFARANNQAFPLCRSDKIALLNSDTVIRDNALEILAEFLDQHPKQRP